MTDRERPRSLWKRPAFWAFAGLAVLALARIAWVSRNGANPLADGLSLVGIAIATLALIVVIALPIVSELRRRSRRDLSAMYATALQFDALLGEGHRAARAQRAALMQDAEDVLPTTSQFARVAVDGIGVRIVGSGWASAGLIPVDEISGIALGIETSGLIEYGAILFRLDVDGQTVDLPVVPFRDGALHPMSHDEIAALAARLRIALGLEPAVPA